MSIRFPFSKRTGQSRPNAVVDGLFDETYYHKANPDVGDGDGRQHFWTFGNKELRSPRPFFHPVWYDRQVNRSSTTSEDSLLHFLTIGVLQQSDPHPLFSVHHYRLTTDCPVGQDPIAHYANRIREGRPFVSPTPYFDLDFYLRTNEDVEKAGVDPFTHYLESGWREGRMPSPYFSPRWYLAHYPDVAEAGLEPLAHFIASGASEGRKPHYLIDLEWYADANPDVELDGAETYRHFVSTGDSEGRSPHPLFDAGFSRAQGPTPADIPAFCHYVEIGMALGRSPHPLFKSEWYAAKQGLPIALALDHYLSEGAARGFDPHPLFSADHYRAATGCPRSEETVRHYTARLRSGADFVSPTPYFDLDFYLRVNPDLVAAGVDPFTHYLKSGWREGRMPSPYFSPDWYLCHYTDVAEADLEPLAHFIASGAGEGRQPHYLIDLDYYRMGNADVRAAGIDPYLHFIMSGDGEGRSAHVLYDPAFYRANGPAYQDMPDFAHYAEIGSKQGRSPCPAFDARHYATIYPHEQIEPLKQYLLADAATRFHFHPLIDGGYQLLSAGGAQSEGCPLMEYVRHRSHLNPFDVARAATSIPVPQRARIAKASSSASLPADRQPKVSVIIPCYKSNIEYLDACISSVLLQRYENWELILADDGSPDRSTWPALQALAAKDARIKAVHLENNVGISRATNAAIDHASGEYLALVDHDDVLTTNALAVMMARIVAEDADAAYSDQAYLTADGQVDSVFLKPNWSPTLFSGVMYVGHLLVVRRQVAIAAGLFDPEFDGCQDYEFMLRVSERTDKILHVPEILYYWRRAEGSVAANSDAKGKIEPKQAKAVAAHFQRIGFNGVPEIEQRVPHRLRIVPGKQRARPSVDVVMQGPLDIKRRDDVMSRLSKSGVEVASLRIVTFEESPNTAIAAGNSPWVLFLDADLEFRKTGWIDYLVMHGERSDVAFVAPHVYRPDRTVESAGLVICRSGKLLKAHAGAREGQDGEAGSLICDREVSVVGATCALIERGTLSHIGGFRSEFSGIEAAVNEASLRATERGLKNIAVSTWLIEIRDAADPDPIGTAIDRQIFIEMNGARFAAGDQYYNSNYAPGRADFKVG
ncbi:MAG: glycosyltransferase [Beijerinckiaceae bacterium]|nr:glycosyltransferase [Beijerinckiaceae bacterium]